MFKKILLSMAALFVFWGALVAEEASAEATVEAAKVECTGKTTCTKNADGTCSTTLTAEDGTVYTICSKCDGCKKACELDGKTVKVVAKCEDGKNVCLESCEECKEDAAEAPAK